MLREALKNELEKRMGFELEGRLLYLCHVGSVTHGTQMTEEEYGTRSDEDLFGVVLPPLERVVGLHPWKETTVIQVGDTDLTVHSLGKYVRLLLKGNLSMLETLWTPEEFVLQRDWMFKRLQLNRDIFSSKRAYSAFAGYARQQIHKMNTSSEAMATGRLGAKRKALVEKNGFDTKNGAHLLRLLGMGIEFLSTGCLQVDRRGIDADLLKDVKAGRWTKERVLEHAESMFGAAKIAEQASQLPDRPNEDGAEEMLLKFYRVHWNIS